MARRFDTAYAAAVFKGILTRTVWDQVMADVDARVADLETIRPDLEDAIAELTNVALGRINEVLTPAIQNIQTIIANGFLTAASTTRLTLVPITGNIYTFVIPEGAQRELFQPSPFVTVNRIGSYSDYAFVRTVRYDVEHGEYVCEIISTSSGGSLGPFNDWVLSAGSGVIPAVKTFMLQTQGYKDSAAASASTATTKAKEASDTAAKAVTDASVAKTDIANAISAAKTDINGSIASAKTDMDAKVKAAGDSQTAAAGSATTASTAAATATTKAKEVSDQLATIAGGPVASVNGKTGIAFTDPVEAMGGAQPTLDLHLTQHEGLPLGLFTRASTAYRRRESGVLTVSAAGVPRIDHDAFGANLGTLFEEARTNVFLNSGAPATQNIALTAGTYTLSLAGTGSATLSGGPTGTATASAPVTFTLAANTTVTVTIAGGPTSVQLEAGAFATSYIPTTTAAVTRVADSLIVPVSSDWFNPSEGTFLVEAVPLLPVPAAVFPGLFRIDDGTQSNRLGIFTSPGGQPTGFSVVGGAASQSVTGAALGAGLFRAALAFKANDLAMTVNGGAVGTNTSAGVAASYTRLLIGLQDSAWSSTIRRLLYVPRRLSDAVLQRITA